MYIPHIENAFLNVKSACEAQLNKLYPAGIPDVAAERLAKELSFLQAQGLYSQDKFEIYRLLCEEAKRSMQYISFESYNASSFILYLLSGSLTNPLPAHYYCSHCGYYESVPTRLFGIDLPQRNCPHCNHSLQSDGFHIPTESFWDITGGRLADFHAHTTSDFISFARRVLERLFPNNNIVPMGTMTLPPYTQKVTVLNSGFYILEEGRTMDDFPQLLSYLEDGTPCLCEDWNYCDLYRITLIPDEKIEFLTQLQQKTGLYVYDISLRDLSSYGWYDIKHTGMLEDIAVELLHTSNPKTYTDLVSAIAFEHSTYRPVAELEVATLENDCSKNYLKIKESKYPFFSREDFYELVQSFESDSITAFRVSESVRKGLLYNSYRKPNINIKYEKQLAELPEGLYNIAINYRYLPSRAQIVEKVLNYAKLAFYLKNDSKIYGKIVFQHR